MSGFLDDSQLEAAKVAFIAEFMARPAFVNSYNGLNNTSYVDTLLNTAGVTLASRQQMIDGLNARTLTRAQVLRQIAESNEVATKYFNQAYAVMEYFGYLRRQPDAFYLDWIAYLNGGGPPAALVTGLLTPPNTDSDSAVRLGALHDIKDEQSSVFDNDRCAVRESECTSVKVIQDANCEGRSILLQCTRCLADSHSGIALALVFLVLTRGNLDNISLIEPKRAMVRRFFKKALTGSVVLSYTRQPAR